MFFWMGDGVLETLSSAEEIEVEKLVLLVDTSLLGFFPLPLLALLPLAVARQNHPNDREYNKDHDEYRVSAEEENAEQPEQNECQHVLLLAIDGGPDYRSYR